MSLDLIRAVLLWCTLLNLGLLLCWFLLFSLAHDWIFRLHSRWFKLSLESFDAAHYTAMAIFKLGILLFNLVPYVALRIVV